MSDGVGWCVCVCECSGRRGRKEQPQPLDVQREEIKGQPLTSLSFLWIKKIINNNGLEQRSGQTEEEQRKLIGLSPVCVCAIFWRFAAGDEWEQKP